MSEGSSTARVIVRPSRTKFFSSLGAGSRRAKVLLPVVLPLMVGSAAMAYAFSHGNVELVAVGAVGGLVLGALLFVRQLLYLACVRLVVEPGRVRRLGFPFPTRQTSITFLRSIVGRNVDFGYGIVAPMWFFVDTTGYCPCTLYAELWEANDMRLVAEWLGGTVQQSTDPPVARNEIPSAFPGPAKRW
jgi:uncharacterized membrane protein